VTADIHTLTGAYVLDACTEHERALIEQHLLECQPCASEVDELRSVACVLGAAMAEQPPARLRAGVLDRIAADRSRARSRHTRSRARRHPAPTVPRWLARAGFAAAAAFLLLAVVLSMVVVHTNGRLEADRRTTSVLFAPDSHTITARGVSGAGGTVVLSRRQDELLLITSGMRRAPTDRSYQLWLITSDDPQSAGLLHTAPDGHLQPIVTGAVDDADRISVTLEPAGGSDHPTGAPVLATSLRG
jgi:anti-sigma-K factor RskA